MVRRDPFAGGWRSVAPSQCSCHVQALYARLLEQCKAQGLAVHVEDIDPGGESNGIMGHARDYHGFVALTITHAKQ